MLNLRHSLFLLLVAVCFRAIPAEADGVHYPLGAIRSDDGKLYVVDLRLPGVWQGSDGKLAHFFLASKKFRTPLNTARCLAFDKDGKVLVGDTSTRQVYRLDDTGKPTKLAGDGVGIGMPMALAVDAEGTIFVADLELHRLFRIPHEGGEPIELATVSAPRGLAFDSNGNLIVVSTTKDQLLKVTMKGEVSVIVPGRPFDFPHNVAISREGTMFVTDGYGKCVWKVGSDNKPTKLLSGAPFVNPVGISISGDVLLVTDPRANAVFEVTLDGQLKNLNLPAEEPAK
ncbi:MAG: NHL repeat-containing protein [Planctomycetota bacterium]|nr:NHL repeat-containing protein [Planctomycetota bacterium]MDA1162927.1 NHL repeat-containing protein [Planctomycetota bacterium]